MLPSKGLSINHKVDNMADAGHEDERAPLLADSENVHVMFGRLCLLILTEGTKRMLMYLKSHLPPNTTLSGAINEKREEFEKMKGQGKINRQSFDLLFPGNGPLNENMFDMTLLFMLIRTLTIGKGKISWTKTPKADEWFPQHDIIRLKNERNSLVHIPLNEFSKQVYHAKWYEVSSALQRLGTPLAEIEEYERKVMDRNNAMAIANQIKSQAYTDLQQMCREDKVEHKRLHIIVTVFVLFVLCLMGVILFMALYFTRETCSDQKVTKFSEEMGTFQYIPRRGWNADRPKGSMDKARLPMKNVVISHTAMMGSCLMTNDCCKLVKEAQHLGMTRRNVSDIAYNYLLGGDTVVYEGRGSRYQGAAVKGMNNITISIGVIGNFMFNPPSGEVLTTLRVLLAFLVEKKIIVKHYKLYGMCQVRVNFNYTPGWPFYEIMKKWPNWNNSTVPNATCSQTLP